jgi:HEAT repeat protein
MRLSICFLEFLTCAFSSTLCVSAREVDWENPKAIWSSQSQSSETEEQLKALSESFSWGDDGEKFWLSWANSFDYWKRMTAAEALANARPAKLTAQVFQKLLQLVEDDDDMVRNRAGYALYSLLTNNSLESQFVERLHDFCIRRLEIEKEGVARMPLILIASEFGPEGEQFVWNALSALNPFEVEVAIEASRKFPKIQEKMLVKAIEQINWLVSGDLKFQLAKRLPDRFAGIREKIRNSKFVRKPDMYVGVYETLVKVAFERRSPLYFQFLFDKEFLIRLFAFDYLVQLKDQGRPYLERLLRDPETLARRSAAKALSSFENLPIDLVEICFRDSDDYVQINAAKAAEEYLEKHPNLPVETRNRIAHLMETLSPEVSDRLHPMQND